MKNNGDKKSDLERDTLHPEGMHLTTDEGLCLASTDDTLQVGPRGPALLADQHFREKMTRFDHERIPERVVHARGAAAHGTFQVYKPLSQWTKAAFLNDPARKTPVFVRFSTVAGPRGSADTVRDVRGFAVKFYTSEGNFDLVGNNMPVFFIQDGIKFPDVIHAVKAEPHHEMPTAASAHDSFWDFVSLVPESMHMVLWTMSDRAIPRSYRMMEGFGVHTFRLVNDQGVAHLVKFHWKPLLGAHSLVWDEAQKLAGFDPDYHRRDLWETLDAGTKVEYELGLQVVEEDDAQKFGFDLLDPTKLLPEEKVPVQRVGKLTLERNPDNYFAETEQVAFCVSHLVPGIEVTDDPLLQARLFSYLDTQLSRLGGPNFTELPINRPLAPVANHQQDGHMRHRIVATRANYHPNSIGGGCPMLKPGAAGGWVDFPQPVSGTKVRQRSPSFADHFSQAAMFLASMTPPERQHMRDALRFELGRVQRVEIRKRFVDLLARVDTGFAADVASGVGIAAPTGIAPVSAVTAAPSLSLMTAPIAHVATRKVAVLCGPGVQGDSVRHMCDALTAAGAKPEVVGLSLGSLGDGVEAQRSYAAAPSVLFDAIYVPAGKAHVEALAAKTAVSRYLEEAFVHGKALAAVGEARALLDGALPKGAPRDGVVMAADAKAAVADFTAAIAKHRHWSREGWGA